MAILVGYGYFDLDKFEVIVTNTCFDDLIVWT